MMMDQRKHLLRNPTLINFATGSYVACRIKEVGAFVPKPALLLHIITCSGWRSGLKKFHFEIHINLVTKCC